jgi:hypothetical protein
MTSTIDLSPFGEDSATGVVAAKFQNADQLTGSWSFVASNPGYPVTGVGYGGRVALGPSWNGSLSAASGHGLQRLTSSGRG